MAVDDTGRVRERRGLPRPESADAPRRGRPTAAPAPTAFSGGKRTVGGETPLALPEVRCLRGESQGISVGVIVRASNRDRNNALQHGRIKLNGGARKVNPIAVGGKGQKFQHGA